MKYFIYILLILSVALLFFNLFQLDFDHLFSVENSSSFIGILAAACVIVLMLILSTSRKIKEKAENGNSSS